MSVGEFWTRFSVWLALAGYFAGAFLLARRNQKLDYIARLSWTIASIALLAHIAFAYKYYHYWSHASAYQETARRTADIFGVNWGGGIYFNYALAVAWITDVAWWWRGLHFYRRRAAWLTVIWQSFLIFMIFNATVVFETGFLRIIGLVLCVLLFLMWYTGNKRTSKKLDVVVD